MGAVADTEDEEALAMKRDIPVNRHHEPQTRERDTRDSGDLRAKAMMASGEPGGEPLSDNQFSPTVLRISNTDGPKAGISNWYHMPVPVPAHHYC